MTNFTVTAPNTGWWRNFVFSGIITLQAGRPFTLFYGNNTLNDVAGGATDRVGGAPIASSCPSVDHCRTMVPRNTYTGDPLYAGDLRLSREFHFGDRMRMNLAFDAFNVLNRPNVDEVTSVYGSPVFCGNVIPRRYNDSTTRAIQRGAVACPVGDGLAIPGVGSFASTPIGTSLFIPAQPNPNFGLPRTMLNPRQLQFSVKFMF